MPAKIGLALSGGGARGLAHIGVLKVLEEAEVPIRYLAGTSMGGIVASLYAAGHRADEIARFARSLRLLDIVHRDRTGLGLLGQDKIAALLRDFLGGDLTFDHLPIPLALTAVDLRTGEEVIIREGSVIEGVLATAALPPLFPPRRLNGRLLVDGGLLNPLPFDVVREMGAERVIAVHTYHVLPDTLAAGESVGRLGAMRMLLNRGRWAALLNISERSMAIIGLRLVDAKAQQSPPDVLISVPLQGVGVLDLDRVEHCLRAGEEAARQHRDELLALLEEPPPAPPSRLWERARQWLADHRLWPRVQG